MSHRAVNKRRQTLGSKNKKGEIKTKKKKIKMCKLHNDLLK